MKAMILAAGRGQRMRHLTEHVPKPLLPYRDSTLIEHNIQQLKAAGLTEIVINLGYLGSQIETTCGNGEQYGVNIAYAYEEEDNTLETGGGIHNALPLLGDDYFLVINADLVTSYPFKEVKASPSAFHKQTLMHLIFVENPDFKATGDYDIENDYVKQGDSFTFSGISLIHPTAFKPFKKSRYPLKAVIDYWMLKQKVSASLYYGEWFNLGTPEQLAFVNQKRP